MKSAIIGAGTYGEVYCSYLRRAGIDITAFIDDDTNLTGTCKLGIPVIGGTTLLPELASKHGIEAVYCPIGNNKIRVEILKRAKKFGLKTPSFIDRSVEIADNVEIGDGVYMIARANIMPFVKIEDFVMISAGSNIVHHSHLKEGVFISNGVNYGAFTTAEALSFIGMGATIMTGVKKIGYNATVGAGTVVIRDVPDMAIVAGVPAKVLRIKHE